MTIIRMKIGFWLLPKSFNIPKGEYNLLGKEHKGFYWLVWKFIYD